MLGRGSPLETCPFKGEEVSAFKGTHLLMGGIHLGKVSA